MAVLVSFLVISKLTLTIGVYYEFQDSLMQMNQAVRDLVQMACAFTEHHKSSSSNSLQAWRFDVANHALLLQMTTTTMLHKTNNMNAWETAGMTESEQFRLKLFLDDDDTHDSYTSLEDDHAQHSRGWAHGYHLDSDLNLRVPIRMAHRLRSVIALHRKFHDPSLHVHTMQEQQLLAPLATF